MERRPQKICILIFLILTVTASLGISPMSSMADQEEKRKTEMEQYKESQSSEDSGARERSPVSAYLKTEVGCMENGIYEQYLDEFVRTDNPPALSKEQTHDDRHPKIYMDFMGWDKTPCYIGETQKEYDNMAICTNLFYLEYPQDWYMGANSIYPLAFAHQSESNQAGQVGQDWKEFFDDKLSGSKEEVEEHISSGGIDGYLEEVIGQPITQEFKLKQDESSDSILFYNLTQNGEQMAVVVIWTELGKLAARNDSAQVSVAEKADYGRIYLLKEWEDVDLSSEAAIREYISSGKMDSLLEPALKERGTWTISPYQTEYHNYLRLEGVLTERRATVYIPITPSGDQNWLLLFEAFKGTENEENAYDIQERMIKTFIILPYYHQVRRGENLSLIAKRYTEDPKNYYEISKYRTNRIKDPDKIYPNQRIEIPLGLLFQKKHYQ